MNWCIGAEAWSAIFQRGLNGDRTRLAGCSRSARMGVALSPANWGLESTSEIIEGDG
jgi:hypothetical protein